MLKRFPDTALAFAVDGVIPPRALGHARQAGQLEQAARRRARTTMDEAATQAAAQRQQAHADGFAAGYSEGLRQAVAPLAALLADVAQLRARLREETRNALQAALAGSGADTEVIVQGCRRLLEHPDDTVCLYLPRHAAALADAVRGRLQAALDAGQLQLRSTDAPQPMLHAGPLVLALDLHGPVLAAAEPLLDAATVELAATQRGRDYALALEQALRVSAVPALPPEGEP